MVRHNANLFSSPGRAFAFVPDQVGETSPRARTFEVPCAVCGKSIAVIRIRGPLSERCCSGRCWQAKYKRQRPPKPPKLEVVINCHHCNAEMTRMKRPSVPVFCSPTCKYRALYAVADPEPLACAQCGESISRRAMAGQTQRFCTPRCRARHKADKQRLAREAFRACNS